MGVQPGVRQGTGNRFLTAAASEREKPETAMITDKELIQMAKSAREKAYAPYSRFRVGAALLCEDGATYTGCNVENASSGATCCAERTAVFKAVSEGHKEFKKIAIAGSGNGYTSPCGICRQVLSEFCGPDFPVIMCSPDSYKEVTLGELLPFAFSLDDY